LSAAEISLVSFVLFSFHYFLHLITHVYFSFYFTDFHLRHGQYVLLDACLFEASHKNYYLDLHENFTRDVSLDKAVNRKCFGSGSGSRNFWKEFLLLWNTDIHYILLMTEAVVAKFLLIFTDGWDIALATNRSILVLIRITILILESLTEFLPIRVQLHK